MRWPWSRHEHVCNRGTLTFLPDDVTILGLPPDFEASDQDVDHISQTLKRWLDEDSHLPVVFNFQVDVIDRRQS